MHLKLDVCKCQKQYSNIMQHLRWSEECKKKFSESEFDNLQKLKKKRKNAKHYDLKNCKEKKKNLESASDKSVIQSCNKDESGKHADICFSVFYISKFGLTFRLLCHNQILEI